MTPPPHEGDGSLRDRAVAAAYLLAWRLVRLLPERWAYRWGDVVADRVASGGGRGVVRLRSNLRRVVVDLDPASEEALVREAVRSYVRYWVDAFRLPDWDEARVVDHVTSEGDGPVRAALAEGRGVVCWLAHLGNWDHAGAWSALRLAPVVTVAERLRPAEVYERFVAFRRSIGIRVLAHDEPGVTAELERVLRGGGFVPLLADRDLGRRGVTVPLLGEPARVAGGPAVLAARTGALLVPVGITYRPSSRSPSGYGLHVRFHPPVPVPDDGPEAVAAATAAVAAELGEDIRLAAADWHMLQRVFVADLEGPRP
ncbi:phosphatidylinositol mannoside acyltransferase [Aquipuribacter nitratireducens]|uniref:Phosphatidylinositol mannoside acyltransferase n=1 Tax=Aquipuribacter nitratireducens TaxID=650104 RepID=A0ABW0GWC7_9MICO